MNYLAHAYLSFDQPGILAGNMISDFVKGKKQYSYSLMIQKGIKLHRAIDNFTDTHIAIKEMKKAFRPAYGLYAGVFIDIICDYFLANDKKEFATPDALKSFAAKTYSELNAQLQLIPPDFGQFFFYMKQYDWLYNYQYEEAIQKSFTAMARRAKYITEADFAFEIFKQNTEALKVYYDDFFPSLKKYSIYFMKQLINTD